MTALSDKGRQLADAIHELDDLEEAKSASASEYAARLKAVHAKIHDLANEVERGQGSIFDRIPLPEQPKHPTLPPAPSERCPTGRCIVPHEWWLQNGVATTDEELEKLRRICPGGGSPQGGCS